MTKSAPPEAPKPHPLLSRINHDLDAWINRARAEKDPNAARSVLALFVNTVEAGGEPDVRLLRYLADSFREMLDANTNDPRAPLGLKRSRAGNPGGVSTRALTPDDKDEFQLLAFEMFGSGKTQAQIVADLSKKPIRPAAYVSKDTIRAIVRKITSDVPRRKAELLTSGVLGYNIPNLLAREFNVEPRTMECVLSRLAAPHPPEDSGAKE